MKTTIITLFSVALSLSSVVAQVPSSQIRRLHPDVLCSNYTPYELSVKATNEMLAGNFDFPKLSPTPDGWKPFYISHYGRHGQRYHYSAKDYEWIEKTFADADAEKNLTDFGKQVYEDFKKICKDADKRAGDLVPLGREQHKGIANRMMQNFPEVFASQSLNIDAKSTLVPRCILSMNAFCSEIIEKHPNAEIYCDASQKYMVYMCHAKEVGDGKNTSAEDKSVGDFYAAREYKGDMLSRLFKKAPQDLKDNLDTFVRTMYYMLVTLSGVDVDNLDERTCTLTKLFTQDELFNQWEKQNFYWYSAYGSSPLNNNTAKSSARWLVANIMEEADKAIAGNGITANLRFGHDTGLVPLVSLLNLDKLGEEYTDLNRLSSVWQDFSIVPMAANLQIVFFKNESIPDKILVKFLLNECDVALPLPSEAGVYYDWKDARAYMQSLIKKAGGI